MFTKVELKLEAGKVFRLEITGTVTGYQFTSGMAGAARFPIGNHAGIGMKLRDDEDNLVCFLNFTVIPTGEGEGSYYELEIEDDAGDGSSSLKIERVAGEGAVVGGIPGVLPALGEDGDKEQALDDVTSVSSSSMPEKTTSSPEASQLSKRTRSEVLPVSNPTPRQANNGSGRHEGWYRNRWIGSGSRSNAASGQFLSVDGERRRPGIVYPDANQLFVGNLPHFVIKEDMQKVFSEFGDVTDVVIYKPLPKNGVKVPYFCHVTFEKASSVRLALERKGAIFMKLNGGGQRRLNVELKRSQGQRRGGSSGDHKMEVRRSRK